MTQRPNKTTIAMSHSGVVHSSILRNLALESVWPINKNAIYHQTTASLAGGYSVIRHAGELSVHWSHGWRGRDLIGRSIHLHEEHLLLKWGERTLRGAARQQQDETDSVFHERLQSLEEGSAIASFVQPHIQGPFDNSRTPWVVS